jgi:hypothetical protein
MIGAVQADTAPVIRSARSWLPEAMWRSWGSRVWLLGLIVAIGAALRLATIGQQSFWLDEAFTYQVVAHGFHHVLVTVPRTESTPPLYIVLWMWSQVFGAHEGLTALVLGGLWGVDDRLDLGRRQAARIGASGSHGDRRPGEG